MKKLAYQIFSLVLVFGSASLFAQENVSGTIKVIGIKEIARDRNPDLFLPKDEFETNAEYAQRVLKQKAILTGLQSDLRAEKEARKKERARLAAERDAEDERQLQIKIAESLAPATFTPSSLGSYYAENHTFPFKINGQQFSVEVPRSEARDFKKQFSSVKVDGYKRLKRDLKTYEYFNMVAVHPITGSRYPFGPTKDLASAPVIASKKSVVPPDLTMKVAFVEPNGNGFLDAEEKGKVKVSISNIGKGSAMGVFVKLSSVSGNTDLSFESSKIIGEVQVGKTKTTEFEISASKAVSRIENSFTISATESYGFPPDPAQISFETFPFIPPKLELVDFGVSTPNDGNEIRPQTTTEVQARLQNRGQGSAEEVKFLINLPKGVYFTPESRQDYSFSSLKPGEFKDLEFSFSTAKTVGKRIRVSIGFTEESSSGEFPLNLDVAKPQQTIQQLVVKGKELGTVKFSNLATISVDIEKDIPNTDRKGKHDLAVVFGIESYKNVPGVSFAKRDATWMKKYFVNVLGIPTKRIYYKTDSDVGQAEFNKVFGKKGWIEKRIKGGKTNVFVYYAGHGAPDKKTAYLIPYDGDPNYAPQTGYEMDKLYEQLGSFDAKSTTVFLDACFSGANRDNEMLLADARPVFMEVDASATRDVTVFSASSGSEISSAWPEKKHGLFSYYLMKGMRGAADENKDKQITVGELGDYIKENVSDMAGMLDREQTPGLQTLDRGKVLIQY
ncbi:MAG: hypothetical protein HOG73_02190 [Candidatus Marinimicrobia bacterium]|jgi:hypothetical protein|nr:hypothetical protein [Candidatus Neomarinimicrobiota bacterium]MBT6756750.1 hypothetical protein [Candidatus Jacksonbacteria bacterium]MBT7271240.1 hypothetical protein [Candidatus Neomarinimicrobiota bacterium]